MLRVALMILLSGCYLNIQAQQSTFFDYLSQHDSLVEQSFSTAKDLYQAQEHKKAIKLLKQEVKANPKHYNAWLFLGFMYYEQEKYPEAITYFNEAIRVKPFHPFGHFLKGNAFLRQESYRSALGSYTEVIRNDPYFYAAYNNIAYVRVMNQSMGGVHGRDLEMAIIEIETIIGQVPVNNEKMFFNLGFFHLNLGDWKTALTHFGKSVEVAPDYGKGHYYKGLTHFYLRNYEEALPHFEKAVANDFRADKCGLFLIEIRKVLDYLASVQE